MRRYTFTVLIVSLILMLLLGACSQSDNAANSPGGTGPDKGTETSTKPPPADVVRVQADKVVVKAGETADVSVRLTVANGYHINANPPSFSYLIPTEVQLQPAPEISVEKAVYPASITKTFAFSKDPLAVYEGEVIIKVPIKVGTRMAKGDSKVGARVRVQPCDDTACYPPRTIDTSIPLTVN